MLIIQSFSWIYPCCRVGLSAQILFPRFSACCGPDGFRASRAWWFFTFNHIALPKTPPAPRVWWQKRRASPGCSPASKETGGSGVHTSQAFLKFSFLCSKRQLGWRLSHQCPHRSCHLPHRTLHPKFGTAGMGRSKHVEGPEVKSCRERLHPGRQTAQGMSLICEDTWHRVLVASFHPQTSKAVSWVWPGRSFLAREC